MKNRIIVIAIAVAMVFGPAHHARADLFGGDVVVLTQILTQAIMQLAKLREILGTAQANIDLVREINRGINDSLALLKVINPNLDPGLYREWETVDESIRRLTDLYGVVPVSPESRVQKDTDQGVAEAIAFNNGFYKYSETNDGIGESIKDYSHQVSPGGAAKLSAQALAHVIQILNQNLRAEATSLKLQAQQLALENRRDKEATRHHLENATQLKTAMKRERVRFDLPRF